MPKLTVEDIGTFEVAPGTRLINALIDAANVDQLHACGGNAACTTCRVQFTAGEPKEMTRAEEGLIEARGLKAHPGVRLSCQIKMDHDMSVKIISKLAGSGRRDAGKRPADEIQPTPEWVM